MRPKSTQVECVCPVCGTKYLAARSDVKRGYRQRCSMACYAKSRIGQQRTERVPRTCQQCGMTFFVRPVEIEEGRGRYCSKRCLGLAQQGDPFARMWSLIDQSGGPNTCWPWQGATDQRGYAVMKFHGKQRRVGRVILELDGRLTTPDLLACHTCDNPPCCNPAHLYAGTPADNADDRQRRQRFRWAVGEERRNSKLTEAEVRAIRAAHESGESRADIARKFGVTPGNIRWIVERKTWKHV